MERTRLDCRSALLREVFASACLAACLVFAGAGGLRPDEVTLKNGLVLQGTAVQVPGLSILTANQNNQGPVPNFPFMMVDDRVRRYFVPRRQVANEFPDDELASIISFNLKHEKSGRSSLGLGNVDAFSYVEPFDNFGRRTVGLTTRQGQVPIIQGISLIRPDYVSVEGLTHSWDYTLDTRTLPEETLQAMIEVASDRKNPAERQTTVRFYLQGKFLNLALKELESISRDFPELQPWCEEFQALIAQEKAREALVEIQQRRSAGQHALAYHIASLFPAEKVGADVFQEARQIVSEYDAALATRDRVNVLLNDLEARLTPEQAERVRPLRSIVSADLHYDNIARLEPFLRAEQDDTLTPEQKLALAYSGWLLGGDNAIADFEPMTRLWDARFLILDYLRESENPFRREELIGQIRGIEGVSIERVAAMIPNLPMPFEPPTAVPGTVVHVNGADPSDMSVAPGGTSGPADRRWIDYDLMLPPEYTPQRRYPLIVALTSARRSPEDELHWWAGDEARPGWAQRRGYIVIAPHYAADEATGYDYQESAHQAVMEAIDHVRQRFPIDSNRIFLAGHGMGGDACFDIAMSHPGIFAGVIPITGICDRYCTYYAYNDPYVAWYVVSGQKDRDTLERNARDLNKVMRTGQDVICCDYKERGYESYHEEQPRLFEWMETHRRTPLAETRLWGDDRKSGSLRATDKRFYWVEAHALRMELFQPISWEVPQRKVRLIPFEATIKNVSVHIRHPGRATTLWLSPELISFDERVQVNVNSERKFSGILQPSIADLLEELRLHGDRERLYWVRLEL